MDKAVICKDCNSGKNTKNGRVRGKQRYRCKDCGLNFVIGDDRTNDNIVAMKALVVLLYALAKGSYNMLGTIFGRDRSLIYRWVKEAGLAFNEPVIDVEIKEIEFDEMWHYIGSKKTNFGLSKPLTVAQGKLSHGYSVVVILQHSDGCTTKSNT